MRRLIPLLFSLSLVAGACITSLKPQAIRIEPGATYSHVATGFRFPPSVAGFRRAELTRYDPNAYDVSATYLAEEPDSIRASVYHYPGSGDLHVLSAQEIEVHFAEMEQHILSLNPGGSVEATGVRPFQINGFRLEGHYGHYYLPRFGGSDVTVESSLYLFALDGWFLKFRISTPSAIEMVDDEIASFISAFEWLRPGSEAGAPDPDGSEGESATPGSTASP